MEFNHFKTELNHFKTELNHCKMELNHCENVAPAAMHQNGEEKMSVY